MAKITINVPDGGFCKGCMFLEVDRDKFGDQAMCQIYHKALHYGTYYGSIIIRTIEKCSRCITFEDLEG